MLFSLIVSFGFVFMFPRPAITGSLSVIETSQRSLGSELRAERHAGVSDGRDGLLMTRSTSPVPIVLSLWLTCRDLNRLSLRNAPQISTPQILIFHARRLAITFYLWETYLRPLLPLALSGRYDIGMLTGVCGVVTVLHSMARSERFAPPSG